MDSTELDTQVRDTLGAVASSIHADVPLVERLIFNAHSGHSDTVLGVRARKWMLPLLSAAAVLAVAVGLAVAGDTSRHDSPASPGATRTTPAPTPNSVTSFAGMRLTHPVAWHYVGDQEIAAGDFFGVGYLSSQPTRPQCPAIANVDSVHPCRGPIATLHPGGVLLFVSERAIGPEPITVNSTMAGLPAQTSATFVPANCPLNATYERASIVTLPHSDGTLFFTLCAANPDQQTRAAITTMFSTATFEP